MEISFTRLRVYLECPWKYKLMFVDGRKIPLTPASALGLSLHRALECFHRSKAPDLDSLLDCYDERWISTGYPSSEAGAQYYDKGRRMLERYFETEQSRRTRVAGVEREFIYPLGRHTVRGMIDRMDQHPDGGYEIIDYKTRLEPEQRDQPEENLQLRFYALGVKQSLAITPARLTVHYLAAGKRETVPYDPSGEEKLKETILEAADRIEAGDFAPDTSFCPLCDFRRTCAHSIARD